MVRNVHYDKQALVRLCEQYGITKLSFFGSVLRNDFDPRSSDIDILVDFEPDAESRLTYFTLGGLVADLEDLLGRQVDLSLRTSLMEELREGIESRAEVQYARA